MSDAAPQDFEAGKDKDHQSVWDSAGFGGSSGQYNPQTTRRTGIPGDGLVLHPDRGQLFRP